MRFLSVLLVVPVLVFASGSGELPQPFGPVYGDHDTGNCKVTVTAHGAIGYTAPDSVGSGFRFPKTVASFLYYCGMLCGMTQATSRTGSSATRRRTWNKDFAIVESLHRDNWYGGQGIQRGDERLAPPHAQRPHRPAALNRPAGPVRQRRHLHLRLLEQRRWRAEWHVCRTLGRS